jgi:hypothetical protein
MFANAFFAVTLVLSQLNLLSKQVDRPVDLVIAVDVSLSMSINWGPKDENKPSDPTGARWDGIQFAIDSCRPEDRVCLVPFMGSPILNLTSHIDPSGFVQMGKEYAVSDNLSEKKNGRMLLKTIVNEIQEFEKLYSEDESKRVENEKLGKKHTKTPRFQDYDNYTMSIQKNEKESAKFAMAPGTSNFICIKKIVQAHFTANKNPDDRDVIFLLFTDGVDERPSEDASYFKNNNFVKIEDFDYVNDLINSRKNKDFNFSTWLRNKLKLGEALNGRRIPLLTFGLGKGCDSAFLQGFSDSFQPEKALQTDYYAVNGIYYHADSVVDLVETMKKVVTSIRQDWVKNLSSEINSSKEINIPQFLLWKDLGVFLAKEKASNFQAPIAIKPDGKLDPSIGFYRPRVPPSGDTTRPRDLKEKTDQDLYQPFFSRSHFFWYLNAADHQPPQILPQSDVNIRLASLEKGENFNGYLYLRPKSPLFVFKSPLNNAKFTIKDSIEFKVDYLGSLPIHEGAFNHTDFELLMNVTPVSGQKISTLELKSKFETIRLFPEALTSNDKKEARSFKANLVFDEDSDSGESAFQKYQGFYEVGLKINAVSGPLKGASLSFINRRFQIDGLPEITTNKEKILLSNLNDKTNKANFSLNLNLDTEPFKKTELILNHVIKMGKNSPFKSTDFKLTTGSNNQPFTGLAQLPQQFSISLADSAWSEIKQGDYSASIEFKTKWGKSITIPILISKTPTNLSLIPKTIVDLSDKKGKTAEISIPLSLETNLGFYEKVTVDPDTNGKLEVILEGTDEKVLFPFTINKFDGKVFGKNSGSPQSLQLSVDIPKDLKAGIWSTSLTVHGENVAKVKIPLEFQFDQPRFEMYDGFQKYDKINDVNLLALSGTKGERKFKINSPLGRDVNLKEVKLSGPPLSGIGNTLPLKKFEILIDPKDPKIFNLSFAVPASISEDTYLTTLIARTGTSVYQIPVYLVGAHQGVYIENAGTLRMKPLVTDKGISGTVQQKIILKTVAEKAMARWYVKSSLQQSDKGLPLLPEEKIKVTQGQKSQNILIGTDEDSSKAKKATEPIKQNMSEELHISVETSGLTPGIYYRTLEFHSYPDFPGAEEGPVYQLPIEIVIPGRKIRAEVDPNINYHVGGNADIKIKVTTFAVDPGNEAELYQIDGEGKELQSGSSSRIDSKNIFKINSGLRPNKILTKNGDSDVNEYEFIVPVPISFAGKNIYKLRWIKAFVQPEDKDYFINCDNIEVEGKGKIIIQNRMLFEGEEIIAKFRLDPKSGHKGPIFLEAIRKGTEEKIVTELFDDGNSSTGDELVGDGIFSGKIAFEKVGTYDLKIIKLPSVNSLPEEVTVAFDIPGWNKPSGTIVVGAGFPANIFGAKTSTTVERAIGIENKFTGHLKLKVQLLYPKDYEDGNNINISKMNKYIASGYQSKFREMAWENFDGTKNLKTTIFHKPLGDDKKLVSCPSFKSVINEETGSIEDDVIDKTTPILLDIHDKDFYYFGLDASLSAKAYNYLFRSEESDKNPTTEGTNLVFVKFNFEWEDGVTGAKHERELIIPLQIVCKGWGYRLLWGIPIILALLVFGFINWNSIKSKTLNLFASLFPNSSNKSSTDDDF